MFIYSKIFLEYIVCVLDVLTVDVYRKIAKIADHQASVQIAVGKSVVAGIILISQEQLIFTFRTHSSCFTYYLCYFCFILWKILSYLFDVEFLQYGIFIFSLQKKLEWFFNKIFWDYNSSWNFFITFPIYTYLMSRLRATTITFGYFDKIWPSIVVKRW